MKYLGNLTEDQTIDFKFSTHQADGTPITLAGTPAPAVKVYKGNATDSETATGVTLSVDFDGVTGLHNVNIDTSAAAFYAVGSDYSVVITVGTVDGVSVVGTVLATFSIENRFMEADLTKINATSIAGTGTQVAIAWLGQYNVASPVFTNQSVNQSGNCYVYAVGAYNRVGAWTATGNNTVLGAMKALMSKVSLTVSDIGGTYDSTKHSTEAMVGSVDAILADTGTDGVVLTSAYDLYTAHIELTVDEANSKDEWTVIWFKNGARVTSGITVPTIQIVKRADGTDLIGAAAMTQIGTTGAYKYDATTTARSTAGEAVLAVVAATIDAASRSFAKVITRDSAAV